MGRTAFFSGRFAVSWNRQVAFYGQGKFLVYSEYVEFRFWVPRAGYPNIQDILMVFFLVYSEFVARELFFRQTFSFSQNRQNCVLLRGFLAYSEYKELHHFGTDILCILFALNQNKSRLFHSKCALSLRTSVMASILARV